MTVVDDETSRLWQLLTELSAQLSANKEHCENLKRQCEQLKTQAIHTGTGFTLRRFNVDITKEQFDSELERFNATLVLENQALQYENRQLSMLLKDYEGTLDNVMAKFRTFAHSSQQYELESARHYETLLLEHAPEALISNSKSSEAISSNSQTALITAAAVTNGHVPSHHHGIPVQGARPAILDVQDPLALQWSLAHLSSLIRKAMRSLQGEDDVSSSSSDEESEGGNNNGAMAEQIDLTEFSASQKEKQEAISSGVTMSTSTSTPQQTQSQSHQHNSHHHDEGEGGYIRLLLNSGFDKSTAALERDIELERLRKENETLREMLGVASEIPATPPVPTPAST